jgi:glucose-6-phosphate isomerase
MDQLTFQNLDQAESFEKLKNLTPPFLKEVLTESRVKQYSIPAGGGLFYNYAALPLRDDTIGILARLAEEQQLILKYRAILTGERMNTGENRRVLHHLTRGPGITPVEENGKDLRAFYAEQTRRIRDFAKEVHGGSVRGSTGKVITDVVQIGIGGSDLGPRALYMALLGNFEKEEKAVAEKKGLSGPLLRAHFISNVDPDDAAQVLRGLDLETSLFILVSKSGTTQETLTNQALVRGYIETHAPAVDPKKHMIAVTSETSPLAGSDDFLESFYIDDYIGGRYSSTSAVGGTVLSLAFGPEAFEELLEGATEADTLALNPDPRRNAAMMDALAGVYLGNVLGYRVNAILPYSQALVRFPAHLQQLDMESNGKQVNRRGEQLGYPTGPIIFGEPGTNGQHSFYQLLHQGTEKVALQFIGFRRNQRGLDLAQDNFTSRQKLNANLAAQILAFAKGKDNADLNRNFPGERPSSLIHGEELSARALGALLAHFENKVMFQGLLWNINSFDQEGVQLGKVLTTRLLQGKTEDNSLRAYAELLGV